MPAIKKNYPLQDKDFCKKVVENLKGALVVIDHYGSIVYCNKSGQELFGYTANEIIGKSLSKLVGEKLQKRFAIWLKELGDAKRNARFVNNQVIQRTGRRKNGTEFEMEIRLSKFSVGGKNYYTGFVDDITERLERERKLTLIQDVSADIVKSRKRKDAMGSVLRHVGEHAEIVYAEAWHINKTDGRIRQELDWFRPEAFSELKKQLEVFRNKSSKAVYESGTGLIGRVWESQKPEWVEQLGTASKTKYNRMSEIKELDINYAYAIPLVVEDEVIGVHVYYMRNLPPLKELFEGTLLAISNNLSEALLRVEFEERVVIERERFNVIAEQTGQLIYDYNTVTGDITWAGAAKKITGYTLEWLNKEMDIDFWVENIHPDDRAETEAELQKALKNNGYFENEYRFKVKDGGYRWMLDNGLTLESDGSLHLLGRMTDIHKQKMFSKEQSYNLKLEESLSEISRALLIRATPDPKQVLQLIGETLVVDRAYIFDVNAEEKTLTNTYEWIAQGVSSQIGNLKNVAFEDLPWWIDQSYKNNLITVNDVDKLPKEAKKEKAEFKREEIKSLMTTPLFDYEGELIGFIGIDQVKDKREWNGQEMHFLRVAGDLFAGYFSRHNIMKNLQDSRERYRLVTKTLEQRNSELEKLNEVMIGRELKMVELKNEIERLKKQDGK